MVFLQPELLEFRGIALEVIRAVVAERIEPAAILAAERVPMLAYHFAFPPVGYVEERGDGFHFVPMSYQLLLETPAA